MKQREADVLIHERFLLGEGPCWNSEKKELSWVDIKTGTLHLMNSTNERKAVQTGQYLGAAIPTKRGRFVGLMTTGIYLIENSEVTRKLDNPDQLEIWQRFNDAKCDRCGRLVAGTMPLFMDHITQGGSLYFYQKEHSRRYDLQVTVPNGMAWTEDGYYFYLVETATGKIIRFAYSLEDGAISNPNTVITVENGMPDGMAIDREGKLWVAIWGGGEVRRYDPLSGSLLEVIKVNAAQVSSCCFGGDDLKTLYITTSAERDPNPDAGKIFSCRTDVEGTETVLFDDTGI